MTMRFRTRVFLMSFLPLAALLTLGFWTIQRLVQTTVRDGVRTSLRENQRAINRIHARSDLQNSRFLKIAGENAALKAGMQLLASEPTSQGAQSTVEDQLRELGEHMGFDLLLVSAPDGRPLAGVLRSAENSAGGSQLVPVNLAELKDNGQRLRLIDGRILQVASVPIDSDQDNIGSLSVGEDFHLSEFATPAVLIDHGAVVASSVPKTSSEQLNKALQSCLGQDECELQLGDENWVSLPIQGFTDATGYSLRTLENMDAAIGPVQARLRRVFAGVALSSLFLLLACSIVSSRSIVKPIAAVVAHLRKSTWTGVLPEFKTNSSQILEIRELAESYNRAAASVLVARESLQRAYVEFVGSLANALDARDRYTAGHSWRVSELSCALAAAMNLGSDEIERIRIGALLHDIGKIGVNDAVLQKPGRLTDEEFAIVKEHPVTGRRILEGVQGFAPFLDAVELHHENWDGSGYPKGLKAEEVPIDARIIHVADAYDAMTTDRSYRSGMAHARVLQILQDYAGIQFDPRIVEVMLKLPHEIVAEKLAQPMPVSTGPDSEALRTV